jgi:hypothetical protein
MRRVDGRRQPLHVIRKGQQTVVFVSPSSANAAVVLGFLFEPSKKNWKIQAPTTPARKMYTDRANLAGPHYHSEVVFYQDRDDSINFPEV